MLVKEVSPSWISSSDLEIVIRFAFINLKFETVKPFKYINCVVFNLFKVASSSAEREKREREREKERVWWERVCCIIISRTSHIHIINFNFILFVLLFCSILFWFMIISDLWKKEMFVTSKAQSCKLKSYQ